MAEYSYASQSRRLIAGITAQPDMHSSANAVRADLFEPVTGDGDVFRASGNKTSDFMVDGLLLWWEERKSTLSMIRELVINLDNGPECSGRRSQFLLRMTEFADLTGLSIRIVYYPPYHSKYNSIERYWAGL